MELVFLGMVSLNLLVQLDLQTEASTRLPVEMELAKVRSVVNLAASTVQRIRDRCAYGWIQLLDLCVAV